MRPGRSRWQRQPSPSTTRWRRSWTRVEREGGGTAGRDHRVRTACSATHHEPGAATLTRSLNVIAMLASSATPVAPFAGRSRQRWARRPPGTRLGRTGREVDGVAVGVGRTATVAHHGRRVAGRRRRTAAFEAVGGEPEPDEIDDRRTGRAGAARLWWSRPVRPCQRWRSSRWPRWCQEWEAGSSLRHRRPAE